MTEALLDAETRMWNRLEDFPDMPGRFAGPHRRRGVRRSWWKMFSPSSGILRERDNQTSRKYPHIVRYSVDRLLELGVFTAFRGTVFSSRFTWLQSLGLLAISAGVCVALWLDPINALDPDEMASLRAWTTTLSTFVTFLLGFFMSTTISRWWAIRDDCIGGLWAAIDDMCLLFAGALTGSREDRAEIQQRVLRYSLLSFALCFSQAQGEDIDEAWKALHQRELVTIEEIKMLTPLEGKPQVAWAWIFTILQRCAEAERFRKNDTIYFSAISIIYRARGAIQKLFAYTDTQLPLA